MEKDKIKFGIPWEYLREGAVKLLRKAGYEVNVDEHSYAIEIDDSQIECIAGKVEQLAQLVEKGILDLAITEKAFVLDSRAKVIKLVDLNYGYKIWKRAKVVLAVPNYSKIKSVKDLEGKKIGSWLPRITKNYFKKHKVEKIEIKFTNMPAEPQCPVFFDGVVEFVNTGASLKRFNLKILDVLMETSAWLIANEESLKKRWKKEKIENLAILLKGARLGLEYSGLLLHSPEKILKDVLKILPALKRPTVAPLKEKGWFDVLTVVRKKDLRDLIFKLRKIGCKDIVEFPLNKVII